MSSSQENAIDSRRRNRTTVLDNVPRQRKQDRNLAERQEVIARDPIRRGEEFNMEPVAPGALEKREQAGLPVEPVWMRGEYAWEIDRPSYFLVGELFLVRRSPEEADGEDWYGCKDATGASVLTSLGLPTSYWKSGK